MSKKTFKRWDQYVAEAAHPDFEIPIDDGHTIRVKTPTGEQVIEMQALTESGGVEQQLRLICGDAADELLPLVKAAPAQVMSDLVRDMMKHFGFDTGEASASSN